MAAVNERASVGNVFALLLVFGCLALVPLRVLHADEPHRSPVDLVLGGDDSWLVTANQTSHTISLVRTSDGQLLHEAAAGQHPTAVVLAPDGRRVLVASRDSGELRVFEVAQDKLAAKSVIYLGYHPHGIAASPDGKLAYVALTAAGQIAVVSLAAEKVTDRIDVGAWPRYVALSPDGNRLAVGVSGDRGVAVVDVKEKKLLWTEKFVGLNVGHMVASADGKYVHFPWMIYRANPISSGNIKLGWVWASRLARMRIDERSRREAISLDPQGKAIADVFGIDLTSDEKRIVVSASGTHELLFFGTNLPYKDYGGTDHIEGSLLRDKDRFDRLDVGGRPMGLQIAGDDRTVYVANYLADAVQVVDLEKRQLVRSIALGSPQQPSLARQGEAIFYDARRSLDQWYSCHTCHYEGSTNALAIDTLNDGSAFTFKTVSQLYHVHETAPWTWHGWQKDLKAAMQKSITSTMIGPEPSEEDVTALLEYLKVLGPPVNPHRHQDGSLTAAAERGKAVFHGEAANCAQCHSGNYFTDGEIHDVGLNRRGDRYQGYNTPTLIGVYQKVRLLHDGRATSLEDVLTGAHAPEKVAGEKLSEEQLRDLIAYLNSL